MCVCVCVFVFFDNFVFYVQDISDLFGADLPVEGGQGGQFAWRDGPLLQALKAGDWVVLDEVKYRAELQSLSDFVM